MSSATPPSISSRSVELLHDFGDILEVGILTLDAALVVRGWNRWLEVASGRSAEEMVGRPLFTLFPELRGSPGEAAFRSALSGTTVVLSHRFHRYLLPLPPSAGFQEYDRMQQSVRIIPLTRDDGHLEGVVALIQDVTERVSREDELRRAMQRAEEASQAKSAFLAGISHDFKTPLAAIIGYVDVIDAEMVGPVTAMQKRHLARVKASAQHLISMIEEVLAFSTVEAGKATVHREVFDAAMLVRDTMEMLEPQAAKKGLGLDVTVPPAPVPMCSDTTKLRQILVNLVGNALKFTDAGRVALEMTPEPDRMVFRVRDTGPGIPPDDLERIFEPYTRLERSRAQAKSGTGLGLPVSRELARLLGGDLVVESRQGEGSTFTLRLPSRIDAAELAEPTLSPLSTPD